MAQPQSHFTVSTLIGLAYAGAGVTMFRVHPEHAFLAAVILLIAGLLPNIDTGPGQGTGREFISFIAGIAPLAALEYFPELQGEGMSRVALIVIISYFTTRVILARLITKTMKHRGFVHSIPAAILAFEGVYLLFTDLLWTDRLYVATAAFVGFFTHLLFDAYSDVELFGASQKKPLPLKITTGSWGSTAAIYCCVLGLGWLVAKDIYPHLRIYAGFNY
jgi:hypothetical protein